MSARSDLVDRYALKLREAAEVCQSGEKITEVHLFGIDHGFELSALRVEDLKDLAERAGLKRSLGTELRKGVRLSSHVNRSK